MKHVRQDVVECFGVPGHLECDIEAFFHFELLHRDSQFFGPHIQRKIDMHLARELEPVGVYIGDDDVTRAGFFANGNCHATDRPGACDEDIFADQIERERSMNGVAEGIETGKHIERNRWIGVPAVVLRDDHEFGPCAGTIHADPLRVRAKMAPSGETIPAMSAGDVTFANDEVAFRETFHVITNKIDNAHELVADSHRHRDRLLCPRVPIVNVDISSTD